MSAASKRLARAAAYLSLALALSYAESLVNVSSAVPGIKLGLANIAVLMALLTDGLAVACSITVLRVVLVSLLFGNVASLAFGMAGALLSLAVMALLLRCRVFGLVGISMAGGACHNLGQLLAAALLFQNSALLDFLPPLLLVGMAAGLLTGLCCWLITKRLNGGIL